jgi:hypothetical protein
MGWRGWGRLAAPPPEGHPELTHANADLPRAPRFPSSSGLQGSPTYSRDPPRHLGFTARSLVHHLPLPDADRGTPEALLPDRNSPRSGRFAGGRKPVAFNPEKTGEENRISKSEPGPLERRGEVSRGTDVVGAWRWSRGRRWPAWRRSPGITRAAAQSGTHPTSRL